MSVFVRCICSVLTYDTPRENVHIMVLPVAETIEKQLMVVLRDREKDLTEFLGWFCFVQVHTIDNAPVANYLEIHQFKNITTALFAIKYS